MSNICPPVCFWFHISKNHVLNGNRQTRNLHITKYINKTMKERTKFKQRQINFLEQKMHGLSLLQYLNQISENFWNQVSIAYCVSLCSGPRTAYRQANKTSWDYKPTTCLVSLTHQQYNLVLVWINLFSKEKSLFFNISIDYFSKIKLKLKY